MSVSVLNLYECNLLQHVIYILTCSLVSVLELHILADLSILQIPPLTMNCFCFFLSFLWPQGYQMNKFPQSHQDLLCILYIE